MEKFIKLVKGLGLEKEEGEEMITDCELFEKLFPLFDCMSIRGKETTINTLSLYLIMEEE